MGKKWWYIRGLQTQLLLVVLCFAQCVVAKPSPLVSPKKGKISVVTKTPRGAPSKVAKPALILKAARGTKSRKATKIAVVRGTARHSAKFVVASARTKEKRSASARGTQRSLRQAKFRAASSILPGRHHR